MVIWSIPAKTDLRTIHDFIANDSPHYAKKVSQDIRGKTNLLDEQPMIGRKVPELNNDKVREILHFSYRIIYEIKVDIFILAIVHQRRDLTTQSIRK